MSENRSVFAYAFYAFHRSALTLQSGRRAPDGNCPRWWRCPMKLASPLFRRSFSGCVTTMPGPFEKRRAARFTWKESRFTNRVVSRISKYERPKTARLEATEKLIAICMYTQYIPSQRDNFNSPPRCVDLFQRGLREKKGRLFAWLRRRDVERRRGGEKTCAKCVSVPRDKQTIDQTSSPHALLRRWQSRCGRKPD